MAMGCLSTSHRALAAALPEPVLAFAWLLLLFLWDSNGSLRVPGHQAFLSLLCRDDKVGMKLSSQTLAVFLSCSDSSRTVLLVG